MGRKKLNVLVILLVFAFMLILAGLFVYLRSLSSGSFIEYFLGLFICFLGVLLILVFFVILHGQKWLEKDREPKKMGFT